LSPRAGHSRTSEGPRSPHRHDYHELSWTRRGEGHHLIDGEITVVRPGTITLIGRGQLHVFEARRPADSRSLELQRHLLSVVLLWVERWYDAARTGQREPDDAQEQLYRRFAELLERRFTRHHDAGHYADILRVPGAALSPALTQVTGRTTKEMVTDRVMLEAPRLLRFTDLSIGEIAFRAGFDDPMYFSRAFKRHHRQPPTAYRDTARGRERAERPAPG
jgi:AraC family transcriptional regulator, transcriptional activator of pobA